MSDRTAIGISIDIASPRTVVWRELERIEDHVLWMADAVAIEFHSDQRRGVGTAFRCRTKIGPVAIDDEMVITTWRDEELIGVEHRGLVGGTGQFELTSRDPESTTVTWSEDLEFPWWLGGGLGASTTRPLFRWIWTGNLKRLSARVIEQSS